MLRGSCWPGFQCLGLQGKRSFLVVCVSLRLGVGGGTQQGKFLPVGSFEMEVTSSGLKKNYPADPPSPGLAPGVPSLVPLLLGHNPAQEV